VHIKDDVRNDLLVEETVRLHEVANLRHIHREMLQPSFVQVVA
jgi:hypothetical protein